MRPNRMTVLALAGLAVATALAPLAAEARNVRRAAHVNVNHHFNVKRNVHVDRHNVNVNKKVNVNRNVHRDVDVDWDRRHYHPVATGVAVGTAAAVTAAAIGSIVYALPSGCGYQYVNGVRYYHCGGVWYEQRYSGSQLTYVVVPPP